VGLIECVKIHILIFVCDIATVPGLGTRRANLLRIRIRIQNSGYLHDSSLFVMQDVTGHVTGLALTAVNKVPVLPYYKFISLQNVVNIFVCIVITN
jgi:hypothetical protein